MPRNPAKIDYTGGFPLGFEHFTVIEDPRTGGNRKHHFGEMIFIAVSSLLCGVQSFGGMIEFAHIHRKWLENWISLPMKQMRAMVDDRYRNQLLSLAG